MFQTVAFDADDTLWHSESLFADAQTRLSEVLAPYASHDEVARELLAVSEQNMGLLGYGVKAFTLAMVEVATRISGGRISGEEVQRLVDVGKDMLRSPVELLDGVEDVVSQLAGDVDLALITKGDLIHQEAKIAASGLGGHFSRIEVVSDKRPDTYRRIIDSMAVPPERFVMVGNSLRSDVMPALEIGAWAVHIPYHITWEHEVVEAPAVHERLITLTAMKELPEVLEMGTPSTPIPAGD